MFRFKAIVSAILLKVSIFFPNYVPYEIKPLEIPEPIVIENHIVDVHEMVEEEPEVVVEEKYNIACYCSGWAQENGVDIPDTDAWDLHASSTPQVGGGVLFKYGESEEEHHVAKILWLLEYGMFVKEANKEPCKITERFVSYNDEFIVGFAPPKKLSTGE